MIMNDDVELRYEKEILLKINITSLIEDKRNEFERKSKKYIYEKMIIF